MTRSVTPARAAVALALALLAVAVTASALGVRSAPSVTASSGDEILVAGASDLQFAFEELGEAFTEATGDDVTFTFGSSGQLATQIVNGAPFHLFASANVGFVDEVIASGEGVASTKQTYAFGRIVVWSPKKRYGSLEALLDPKIRFIAIANPEHAPYGVAAQQALEDAGIYERVKSKLVYGENIADTLRLVKSGNADVGIVALSLAIVSGGRFWEIPPSRYEPLEQALVVTSTGQRGVVAQRFASFVMSEAGRRVMRRYGFFLPGERRGT